MKIYSIFQKDINRNIETVIKVDSRDNIRDEVAEYVITDEINKKIKDFFAIYKSPSGVNGVWISGFFGSGKSHLLKILSYVLENKEDDGDKIGDLFVEKIEGNQELKGDVKVACKIPSESILFNIDQQAEYSNNKDIDNPILNVFYKEFYNHLGYYGSTLHVAEFEMWLDDKGILELFKAKYNKRSGKDWINHRRDYWEPKIQEEVSIVLGELRNTASEDYIDVLEKFEKDRKQSIDDFSDKVQGYISKKERDFRLNFFVDEVGQFISENTKLMLNLQTIAESLATKTGCRSWILVTSQEDMEAKVGELDESQLNDFSKIQDRFKIKIPLTSSNVEDVIEKRLLKKKVDAQDELISVFSSQSEHLKTIYSFSEGGKGKQFKGYENDSDFANKFPFIPYQFSLFQECRRSLSIRNAFQGKHSSVGERSMLSVFQHVTRQLGESELNSLVSFDRMFDGIRNELKSEILKSISLAENQLGNPFAIRVLKLLFLVKYYTDFKTTKKNICVLLIDSYSINLKLKELEKKIKDSLELLENQSYIRRNGELYEFLTDDEKDVEQEIKNVETDPQAVNQVLKDILYDSIIASDKIKYKENGQNFRFHKKIDGSAFNKQAELVIEIITPNYKDYKKIEAIRSQTMGSSILRIYIPEDNLFIKDLKSYVKTEKYLKQKGSLSQREEIKRIHFEKRVQNENRKSDLKVLTDGLLSKSKVFVNGTIRDIGTSSDGKTLVINAFQILVKTAYTSLKMLGNELYNQSDIHKRLTSQNSSIDVENDTLSESENAILDEIIRRKGQSERTSLNNLKEHFGLKPYGWEPESIWYLVAGLYKLEKIELKQDSNVLEDKEVEKALLNNKEHENTLIDVFEEIPSKLISDLRNLYFELFDKEYPYYSPPYRKTEVAQYFNAKLSELSDEVNVLIQKKDRYPFLTQLESIKTKLESLTNKDYTYFLKNIAEFKKDLLDPKKDLLDPIRKFMTGEQKKIYDDLKDFVTKDNSNFSFIEGDEIDQLKEMLSNKRPFEGSLIRNAKSTMDTLREKEENKVKEEKETAVNKVKDQIDYFEGKEEFSKLKDAQKEELLNPFNQSLKDLNNEQIILKIRDIASKSENTYEPEQLTILLQLTSEGKNQPTYIKQIEISVSYHKRELKTVEDVDEYVETLRTKYKEEIIKNHRISL
ncbi:MAG: BREX system P-loop protein BrxC [Flavobacteriaceae bacterium]|nr:BREX system P-loop protein BrxC [Flavobacteriaceae bacterium]